jgi:hypothetical protein
MLATVVSAIGLTMPHPEPTRAMTEGADPALRKHLRKRQIGTSLEAGTSLLAFGPIFFVIFNELSVVSSRQADRNAEDHDLSM